MTSTGVLQGVKLLDTDFTAGSSAITGVMQRPHAHRRLIDCHGWQRDDGLWQIEVSLRDTKGVTLRSVTGRDVTAGEAIHHMVITLVVDGELKIQSAKAQSLAAPAASCHEVEASYAALAGLTIGPGLSRAVRERFGGVKGCTHLTEMLPIAATVAIQTILGARLAGGGDAESTLFPQMVDECHTWRRDGPLSRSLIASPRTGLDHGCG